ncbi:MAG: HAMP domain-containing sensor histidine kinase, partial [Phycisphaerae bacterium]|nr:HAMP domain-containing sensor histidine kinase [Phycisphaerae bacterium]
EVVERALEMLQFDERFASTQVERRYAPEPCFAWIQPYAMQQVLVNLLINALDATRDVPTPRLTVVTGRRDDGCFAQVIDNGYGIARNDLSRIFEPFFTTKPVGKGTGLGLSISYSLVRRQGGQIDVESEPGRGATFTIRLPSQPANLPISGTPE